MTVIPLEDYYRVQDIVKYVARCCEIEWEEDSPPSPSRVSPMTEALKNAIHKVMDDRDGDIEELFGAIFPSSTADESRFISYIYDMELTNRNENYSGVCFLSTCVIMSTLALSAFKLGITSAPVKAIYVILRHIEYYRRKGQFPKRDWMQHIAETVDFGL